MVRIIFFLFMTPVRKCISQINSATVNWKTPQMIKNSPLARFQPHMPAQNHVRWNGSVCRSGPKIYKGDKKRNAVFRIIYSICYLHPGDRVSLCRKVKLPGSCEESERSASRGAHRVCVAVGSPKGGGHNFTTLQPSSLPQLSLKFSERKKTALLQQTFKAKLKSAS